MWSGSLGAGSTNRAALEVAVKWLAAAGADIDWVRGFEQIPGFRADQVDLPPSSVAGFRRQIEAVDAVLIAVPEYAGGIAGIAKNALDWLVGSASLYHKLAGVLSVGTTGGNHARDQLIRTLAWQGALPVASLGVEAPRTRMTDGAFTDAGSIAAIEGWAADVVLANRLPHAERVKKTLHLLEPLGIDPARFGDGPPSST